VESSKRMTDSLAHAIENVSGAMIALAKGDQATALRDISRAGRYIATANETLRDEMRDELPGSGARFIAVLVLNQAKADPPSITGVIFGGTEKPEEEIPLLSRAFAQARQEITEVMSARGRVPCSDWHQEHDGKWSRHFRPVQREE